MSKSVCGNISRVSAILCGILMLAADRVTKQLVVNRFTLGETRTFLKGFIDLTYIHNRGGAWGMLSGKTYILLPFTAVVMALCVWLYVKYGRKSALLLWAVSLVLSGGLGNMLDRAFRGGNVVDFLHFEFFPSFPVFNVADIAIVTGAGLLILYFLRDGLKEKRESENDKA